MVFLDTSALYALADAKDINHERAKTTFAKALEIREELILHNYILVESAALIQRRLGFSQAKTFLKEATQFSIVWIDASLHAQALEYFSKYGKRRLSFVDCASFVFMKQEGITTAFAFDDDFTRAGFTSFL